MLHQRELVAIVGMGCRFPGGVDTPAKFWSLLVNGQDGVREIDRWNATEGSGLPRWGATLDGIDQFDAEFFGIQALEASRMDPQQRLLLEVVWEALENAGQPVDRLAGSRSGVFVGIYNSDYAWEQNAAGVPDDVYSGVGSGGAIAANRLSYLLDLRGPSMAVDTTCSSSLVATHLAVESLRRRESDLAIAAGVNLTLSASIAKSVSAVIPIASDGFCKPFDSRADGIVRGEGCAALVLKRLSDALADGDPILASIAGSAVNQDGKSNGFTAPNLTAQQEVIRAALTDAGVDPAAISYVEAHGTGTALGDPIEWEALEAVIGRERKNGRCLVGSVKANIGHCEAAAGIAGLAKVILALQHRRIPMQAHLESPNPRLVNYGRSLIAPSSTIAWSAAEPRRAGVSAFSVGGTNAHIIVEEAPGERYELAEDHSEAQQYVLPISAKSPEALRRLIQDYIELLDKGADVCDVCYSAARKRTHLPLRITVSGDSAAVLRSRLLERLSDAAFETREPATTELAALCAKYERGHNPDWTALSPRGHFIALPNYPWQRQRYWFSSPAQNTAPTRAAATNEEGPGKYVHYLEWVEARATAASSLQHFDLRSVECAMSAALPDLAEESGFTGYRESVPRLEECAGRAIEAALFRAGWHPAPGFEFLGAELRASLGVEQHYHRLFARALEVLAEDGALEHACTDRWRVLRPLRDFEWNDAGDTAVAGSEASVLRRCTSKFFETLRGECNPIELLFPDGSMEQAEALFSESAFAKFLNGLAARALAAIAASGRPGSSLRVLEIGAGTGGTTAALLAECPPDRTQYLFTDISPSFFSRAREKFARYPFISYRTLDIERDPGAQGFEGQTFDLVLAAHVLHATADVRESLRNARALLAPGGILLLVESTARQRLTDFTYGLTPGWWRHADEDIRVAHPLLPAGVWIDLLRASGFETAVCTPDAVEAADYGAAVIVAKASQPAAALGRWIIVGDSSCAGGFRTALESRGCSARMLSSANELEAALGEGEVAGVIHLGGLDASCCEADTSEQVLGAAVAPCRELIGAARTLARRSNAGPRLWLITCGSRTAEPALAQSPLDAVGAVVATEYPGIWGGSVDLEPGIAPNYDRILDSILAAAPGAELAIRTNRVLSPAMVRAPLHATAGNLQFDRLGAYLITGGFGGMGLRVAEWMSERHAGCLVLAGRQGATPQSQPIIEHMNSRGTVILQEAVDVSDEAALRALLARIRRSNFALRGVIHAAGIFEDQLLARHDWDSFRRVFLPKAAGAWNLHRLTSNCRLDHFVLFSSAARFLNPTGLTNYVAANAFLDALSHYRRSRSLPAISICWAGWTATGMARALSQRRVNQWEREGVRSLEPDTGLRVLELLLQGGPAQVLVMDIDRRLHNSDGESRRAAKTALAQQLAGRATLEWERIVREHVAAEAVRIMDNSEGPIETSVPLAELGFDSLMSLELRNALGTAAGLDLPASFVFDYPTIDAIARRLMALMFPDSVPTQQSPAGTANQMHALIRELDGLSEVEVQYQLERYVSTFLQTS